MKTLYTAIREQAGIVVEYLDGKFEVVKNRYSDFKGEISILELEVFMTVNKDVVLINSKIV